MTDNNRFSQVVLSNKIDKNARPIAYEALAYEDNFGDIYGGVQKGYMEKSHFVRFGNSGFDKSYPSFEIACKATYKIAKERIANL